MDLKGLKFSEVDGSQQLQGGRGIYRGLEYELDLLQEAGVREVRGMRRIYRGLEYQADFLTAGEAEGFRGIYRGVAYERESLPEEKLEAVPQADHKAETMNHIILPNIIDGRESLLSLRE